MIHDKTNHTCDAEPTLTDSQVPLHRAQLHLP